MAQLPPAPAPAVPLIVVAYDLLVGSNAQARLTPPSIVRLPPYALIIDLQQAVFAANANTLRGRDYTSLDVYPPGSTDWTDRDAAVDAEDDIARLLPEPDVTDRRLRRFVVVVRPLPSFGAARGQSSLSSQHTLSSRPFMQPPIPLQSSASLTMHYCSPRVVLFLAHSLSYSLPLIAPALLTSLLLLLPCRALLCCARRQRAPHPLSQPSGRGGTRMRPIAPMSRRWTRSCSWSAIDST